MNNEKRPPGRNPLKKRYCEFCTFVCGHVGEAPPHTRTGAGHHSSVHNNKSNNNIYINRIEGGSVPRGGIA